MVAQNKKSSIGPIAAALVILPPISWLAAIDWNPQDAAFNPPSQALGQHQVHPASSPIPDGF
jgi:hypothetical protein